MQKTGAGAEGELFGNGVVEKLHFEPVLLPHDWAVSSPLNRRMGQAQEQGFYDRWGIGWYKRKLEVRREQDKVYLLCFDGVYEDSTVWVNGTPAGGRKYGYSSFSLDITDLLKDGDNDIMVKVDNTKTPADRWYSGAGIYRKVYLQILPVIHFAEENVRISMSFDGRKAILQIRTGMQVPVKAVLSKNGQEYYAESRWENAGGKGKECCWKNAGEKRKECRPEDGEEVIVMQVPDYIPWCAEAPELYDLKLQPVSGEDEVSFKIGFRKVSFSSGDGLRINGVKTKLKGVCLHQDAGCFGTAVTKELLRQRLEELKKIGCNALRLAHHIFMPEMLELCDEMGFYVYEECFDKWTGGAYGRYYQEEWEKDLTCMVKRDRNHPCILFWGVGNEVENQAHDFMLALLEKHVEKVREHDDTRPISVAMNPHFGYPGTKVDMAEVRDIQQFVDEMKTGEIFDIYDRVDRIRLIAEKVDFLCCNYQEQWYDAIHEVIPDKAILGTETYMYFRGEEDKFQNFTEENPWFDVEKRDYCIGGMIWTGIDYLGESMGYPARGWSGALFAEDMEKRFPAWLYQSYWTGQPMIRFAVLDYTLQDEGVKEHWGCPPYVTHWDFPQFQRMAVPYAVATNCEEVEIHVNEKVFLAKPASQYPNHMITGYLPYLPGKVTVIGKNGGEEVCRQVVATPGRAVKLAFEEEEREVLLTPAEQGDVPFQMFLKVRTYDIDGNPVFRESAKVCFSVEGPAEIVGVENGDMKNWEDCCGDGIHLYQGRASVALRITGEGRVRVTASASGLMTAYAVVVSRVSV